MIKSKSYVKEINKWSDGLTKLIHYFTIEGVGSSDKKYLEGIIIEKEIVVSQNPRKPKKTIEEIELEKKEYICSKYLFKIYHNINTCINIINFL